MITSVDAEKAFDKTEFLLVVKKKKKKKLLANLEEKGNSLIWIVTTKKITLLNYFLNFTWGQE